MADVGVHGDLGLNIHDLESKSKRAIGFIDRFKSTLVRAGTGLQQFGAKIGSVGKSFSAFGRRAALVTVGIGAALTALVFKSIQAASALEEMENKFEIFFKETAEDAKGWATTYAESVGLARSSVMGWMADIQGVIVSSGMQREESAKLSFELVKLAADLASVADTPIEDAVRAVTSGMIGLGRSLRFTYGKNESGLEPIDEANGPLAL